MTDAAIVLSDRTGTIQFWNAGAERLFGHPAAVAVGQPLDLIVPPEFRERHWAGFNRAMHTADCKADRTAFNLPVRRADGTVQVFPARFVFLTDPHGDPIGALAIYGEPNGEAQPFSDVAPRRRAAP
jgi:PAS domain S-box-containing protein